MKNILKALKFELRYTKTYALQYKAVYFIIVHFFPRSKSSNQTLIIQLY